jgi:general secretion pathway protein C
VSQVLSGEAMGRLNRWTPVLVKVVAVVWSAWVLAGLLWLLSGHDHTPLPAMAASAVAQVRSTVDTASLAQLDIFGAAKAPDAAQGANAPDTTLQLKLNGVFLSGEAKESTAIVSEAAQPAGGKLYHIDDSLPGGATLASVYEDRILIRRGDGGSETLRFEKPSTGGPVGAPDAASGPPPGAPNVRNMLDQASAAMAQSPDTYLQSLGLVRTDKGYEVAPNAPDSVLQSAGLKPGDRIVSINGQTLGNPVRDRALLTDVKNRGSARVEVQRGAQTLTIEQKF